MAKLTHLIAVWEALTDGKDPGELKFDDLRGAVETTDKDHTLIDEIVKPTGPTIELVKTQEKLDKILAAIDAFIATINEIDK
jgi:hypothetical protein